MAVSLSTTQLIKPFHRGHEHNGVFSDRGELLLNKIENGEEIELNNSAKIIIDKEVSQKAIDYLKNKKYSLLGGRNKLFVSTKGEEYSLTDFKKNGEFGGGGKGTGGGSENTDIQESSQCAVNALCYKLGRNIKPEDLTEENLQSIQNLIQTTLNINVLIDFISGNAGWQNSLILTANIFYSHYKAEHFIFHKGSNLVNSIYKAFAMAKRNSGVSLNNDKWNPADIWAVNPSFELPTLPTDLAELNLLIAQWNLENKLIGISLKKLGTGGDLVKVNGDKEEDDEELVLKEIQSSNKSTNVTLHVNDSKIQFRTFSFAGSFAGEIMGKSAAHGKIGINPLNDALKYFNEPTLEPSKEVKVKFEEKDKEIIKEFYKYYKDIVEDIDAKIFLQKIGKSDLNYLVSKFLSCKISYIIKYSQNQSQLLDQILNYASSTSVNSSMFVKIYESMQPVTLKKLAKYLKEKPNISSLMLEHIKSGRTLLENSYKKGSNEYLELFREARTLYSKGLINIQNPKDLNLIKTTMIGEVINHKGKNIPLDFPLTENQEVVMYHLDRPRGVISKIKLNESFDDRVFSVECNVLLDKNSRDTGETLSDIRAIEGITIVNIEDVDDNYTDDSKHNITIKIKIDPSPFAKIDKSLFLSILNKITKLPGVLRARYVSKINIINK